jgi:hypothetical protein
MTPLRNSGVPDPFSSPEGKKLKEFKEMFKKILKEMPDAFPKKEVSDDINTLRNDLIVISRWIENRDPRKLARFLESPYAVSEKTKEAVKELAVAMSMIELYLSTETTIRQKADCSRVLSECLSQCETCIKECIRQYKI